MSQLKGSEDCLYLNVWTPTLNPQANLPVMVWIHGGSLQVLNGNWPTYSPTTKRIHVLPNLEALNVFIQHVFVHLLSGTGAFHRLSFVGGKAYGIPLKTYAVDLIPRTGPQSVWLK
jgi:hypothetical protein